jgi:hypothetical protein
MYFARRSFLTLVIGAGVGSLLPSSFRQADGHIFNKIGKTYVPLDHDSLVGLTKYIFDNQEMPTARTCLICQQPIEKIGGKKMIRNTWRGTSVSDKPIREGPVHKTVFANDSGVHFAFRSCRKLLHQPELHLNIWGADRLNSERVINRAIKEYLEGTQPWFCQKCGYRQCSHCGEPHAWLAYGDYAYDDGGRGYYTMGANLGACPPCINPKCEKYRSLAS